MTLPQFIDPTTGQICLSKRQVIALIAGAVVSLKTKSLGYGLLATLASAEAMRVLDFPPDVVLQPVGGVAPSDVISVVGQAVQQAIQGQGG